MLLCLLSYSQASKKVQRQTGGPKVPTQGRALDETLANGEPSSTGAASRIVGGTVSPDGAYPWFGRTTNGCGASLIHPEYAVSAFHCVDVILDGVDIEIEIYFGANDFDGGDAVAVRTVTTDAVFYRDDYDPPLNDIVLYHFPPVTNVEPIPWNDLPSVPNIGALAKAIGFGVTTNGGVSSSVILMEVELELVDDSVCNDEYRSGHDDGEIICTRTAGKGTCQGDSGGPLVRNGLLLGMTSYGGTCGASPDVYAATSYHRRFIYSVRMSADPGMNPATPTLTPCLLARLFAVSRPSTRLIIVTNPPLWCRSLRKVMTSRFLSMAKSPT